MASLGGLTRFIQSRHGRAHHRAACPKALETTDILLSIVPHLDVGTLLNLRLARKSINNIILENLPWICNCIARARYSWVFKYSGRAHRDPHTPHHLRKFSDLRRLSQLHISSILATLLLWTEFIDGENRNVLVIPSNEQASSCARGFLILWDLADIEHRAAGTRALSISIAEYLSPLNDGTPRGTNAETRGRLIFPGHGTRRLRVSHFLPFRAVSSRLLARFRRLQAIKESFLQPAAGQLPRMDRPTAQRCAEQALAQKLEYVKDLDQGAWADLQAATAAILAYCNLYMSNMLKANERGLLYHDSLRQAIEWLVRQGPGLLLGMLSQYTNNRKLARQYIQGRWLRLPPADRIWQSELYGNSWDAEEAKPEYDFRALLLWNGLLYQHSRQEEWNEAGYPTLWECVKETLRQWTTYDLEAQPEAVPMAIRLRGFKSKPR